MNKEIREIIEKSLPAQVGAVLKETLAKAESDAIALGKSEKNLDNYREANRSLERKLNAHAHIDDRETSVGAREKAVEKKEVMQEVDILKIKLEESEKRAATVTDFTQGLVRNTIYRKTILDNENRAGYTDLSGNYVEPVTVNKSFKETKEEE